MSRLPPLNAVRAFEAAARLGSYVAAADHLHVTQPAIGRHVKLLEQWLGQTLFQRTPRGVVLTSAGRQYYAAISSALQQIADAGQALQAGIGERWLRLRVVPGFASRWLAPQLPALRQLRPGLRIAMEPHATFDRLDPQRADIAIGFGDAADYQGQCQTLARPAIYPVCAPSYLEQAPPLHRLADLPGHALIHEDDGAWWNHWLAAQGLAIRVEAELSYLSFDHAIDQVLAGQGIALANDILVLPLLQQGRLLRPLPDACVLQGYQLLLPDGAPSADVSWFCDWLRSALSTQFPAPDA
ncbi:LysR substrate-binding domain-containing protein [Chitinimonas sp.]|uniref:LysR substrate-binding domain-containing protein n=1 Tax=Chitinimonas sp. TaxID=1934313 RepID=UPI0035B3DB55